MRSLLAALALTLSLFAADLAAAPDLYVSPDGGDDAPGTRERPLAGLSGARDRVRAMIEDGLDSDVVVRLRGGVYRLSEPVTFGPRDSGTAEYSITYAAAPGEEVVVSGGSPVTGWRRGEDGVWIARVKKGRHFHQLYVNGRRAIRARTPNRDDRPSRWQLRDAVLSEDLSTYTLTLKPGTLKDWAKPGEVEVMVSGNWAINRKRLQAVRPQEGVAVLAPPHTSGLPWNAPRAGRWCYFENAREMLDRPGEWHLDRAAGLLSYMPREGEDMREARVIAPVADRLIRIQGTPQEPVRNLYFRGISFRHTGWTLPEGGYRGVQACHFGSAGGGSSGSRWLRLPGAVRLDHARGCSFEDCELAHLGACGIELVTRCRDNTVRGCHVFDVAGNGIMIGGPTAEENVPRGNTVSRCRVHHCGARYHGGVGIWVGIAARTTVARNHVREMPYTGVSVGWQWNPQPTPCRENTVARNHIHEVMKQLADGGCIYTLGLQPGTVIRGNHLHGVRRGPFAQGAPNNGMFIDQGSKGYLFERNVVYDTSAEPVRFNQCRREWHTWKDNYFGVRPPGRAAEGEKARAVREIIDEAGP